MQPWHATTVLAVRHAGKVALGADGQVTLGDQVLKHQACKVRSLYNEQILAGFAGGVADAIALFERFEAKLKKHQGLLLRAAVDLARDWRCDKVLRRLQASLVVADSQNLLLVTGDGDLIEPDDCVLAVGSGAGYAKAAAQALCKYSSLSAEEIVCNALTITADICIYTNHRLVIKVLGSTESCPT